MLSLILCAALQAAKPEKPLDPKDPASVVEHAVYNTRSQKNYETAFTSRMKATGSDAFERQGTCLWMAPGLLSLHYTGSGREEMNVIRAGRDVWVYQGEWLTAEEAFKDGAGRGIQNPDEVMAVLSQHASRAKFDAKGEIDLEIPGADLVKIINNPEVDPLKSSLTVHVEKDKDLRVKSLTLKASVTFKDPGSPAAAYEGRVDVTAFNGAKPIQAVDAKGKEIPLSKSMRQAIEAFRTKP